MESMTTKSIEKTPWEMANDSERVALARSYVFKTVGAIANDTLRRRVEEMLLRPQRSPAVIASSGIVVSRECDERVIAKLQDVLPYDPTVAAPGSNYSSHHCYPGGWAVHTALNVKAALDLADQAEMQKRVAVDRDAIVAAMALHDWAKLKLLVWDCEHFLDAFQGIGHHPLVLAECMAQEFPPRVVQLMAGAHGGWWIKPESVRESILRALNLIGVDPETSLYVTEAYVIDVEGWIMRQAELCWYDVTKGAVQEVIPLISKWREERSLPFVQLRLQNAVLTSIDELELYHTFGRYGEAGLFERLDAWLGGN